MKNKGYTMVILRKTNGNVIPQGMNKRIKAFIRKNYKKSQLHFFCNWLFY